MPLEKKLLQDANEALPIACYLADSSCVPGRKKVQFGSRSGLLRAVVLYLHEPFYFAAVMCTNVVYK
jgi:hypothetical protein